MFLLFKNQIVTVLHILLWIGSSFRKPVLKQFKSDTETMLVPTLPVLFSNTTWAKESESKARGFALPSLLRNINFSSVCAGRRSYSYQHRTFLQNLVVLTWLHGPQSFCIITFASKNSYFSSPKFASH